MCARFTNEFTWAELHALYKLSDELFPMGPASNMQPRYNIAPTQDVDFVANDKGWQSGTAAWTVVAGAVLREGIAEGDHVQRPD